MEEHQPRKLAVILHADVVGSTTLVQKNESLAHTRIQDAFRRFSSTIEAYSGMTHELRGDALVAEFARASDAVAAGLAFQIENTEANARLEDDLQPRLRIGISLGEVVIADSTITGAGVVLAQRVEQLAEPGGLCITGAVHEAVPQYLPLDYSDLGKREAKGFDEPVQVYSASVKAGKQVPSPEPANSGEAHSRKPKRLWTAGAIALLVLVVGGLVWWQPWVPREEPASIERMVFPLPDEPSIVVLPLDNLSGDPEQEHFADGFTETIIATLSQIPQIFVISRNSAFTYKGKPVRVRQVAEDLGVRYVLEGSIQQSGERVRITVQLIDAVRGHHLWSERYDRTVGDLFHLQDEVALKILVSLQVELTMGEQARVLSRTTESVRAWTYYTQAFSNFMKFSPAGTARARELAEEALALDHNFADAIIILGFTHLVDARNGYSRSREDSLSLAADHASNAKTLAPDAPMLYNLEQSILRLEGRLDEALMAGERAIELSPSTSISLLATAMTAHFAGEFDRSIELAKQAMRHNPHYPSVNLIWLGWSSWFKGDYQQATVAANEGLTRAEGPAVTAPHYLTLALVYAETGELEKARQAVSKAREVSPRISVGFYRRGYPYKNAADQERLLDTLRRVGLPD